MHPMDEPPRRTVAVIGGGIAGTTAAYVLRKLGNDVIIFEQSAEVGGRLKSLSLGGGTVELGAGFIANSYHHTWKLLKATGLSNHYHAHRSQGALLWEGRPVTATASNLLRGRPISHRAMAALAADLAIASKHRPSHPWLTGRPQRQNLEAYQNNAGRRDLYHQLIQPLLTGYFYWDAAVIDDQLWYFLLSALMGRKYVADNGLQALPKKLAQDCVVYTSHFVENIHFTPSGCTVTAHSRQQSREVQVDGVVVATTADQAQRLTAQAGLMVPPVVTGTNYSSTVLLAQAFPAAHPGVNSAVAYPETAGTPLAAVTTATGLHATITKTYASGKAAPQLLNQPDAALRQVLGGAAGTPPEWGPPTADYVQRWTQALPIFDPLHVKQLREWWVQPRLVDGPPLTYAGDYLGGPYIEGAVYSGRQAALALHHRLQSEATYAKLAR